MRSFDAAGTAALLPLRPLMAALAGVLGEYGRGQVSSPARLAMAGNGGTLLSMPCGAADLLVHKLLTVFPGNAGRGLPAIQGQVTCFDAANGTPLFALDGPVCTARRTAAVTVTGIVHLLPSPPTRLLLIGTGVQAAAHAEAALELFPSLHIAVRGRTSAAADAFCARIGRPSQVVPAGSAEDADVVVALTTSRTPVYDAQPLPGRLVVGAGAFRLDMAEIGARTIRGSQLYVDDPVGAPGEAGDMVAAGVDWAVVRPLARALSEPPDFARPVFLKSVGCAAWDLAACRTARSCIDM